jgi:hypothetical protein
MEFTALSFKSHSLVDVVIWLGLFFLDNYLIGLTKYYSKGIKFKILFVDVALGSKNNMFNLD